MGKTVILDDISLQDIKMIALSAGEAVMQIYKEDFSVELKDDNSPLTKADIVSNEIICSALQKLYPTIPILSEENRSIDYEIRKHWEHYWCIDPIDGTKEFIKKNGEFTINIALIHKDKPVLGVVYAPAINEMYTAKKGEGAYKNGQKLPLHVKNGTTKKPTVVVSRSHLSLETQEFIDTLDAKEIIHIGSSLKLCMVAQGSADIYPKLGPTMEWDTAAADAIVREAGKMTYQFNLNNALVYNKQDLLNPWFIVK